MPHRALIHRTLAVRSSDPILHHIAPIGLAAAAGRCLVIDLDPHAPRYPGRTLADFVADGPTAADLQIRPGVALLGNGGVSFRDAAPIIDRLSTVWGRLVVRNGAHEPLPFPTVTVQPLLPPPFTSDAADVVQTVSFGQTAGDRPTLPPLRRQQVRAMLAGTVEPRWRWIRAWKKIWIRPWE